jgi:hypothetical protein
MVIIKRKEGHHEVHEMLPPTHDTFVDKEHPLDIGH